MRAGSNPDGKQELAPVAKGMLAAEHSGENFSGKSFNGLCRLEIEWLRADSKCGPKIKSSAL
jgi:hypothetical protein